VSELKEWGSLETTFTDGGENKNSKKKESNSEKGKNTQNKVKEVK